MLCQLFVKTIGVMSIVRKDPLTQVAGSAVRGIVHEFRMNFTDNNLFENNFEPALRRAHRCDWM
jgi:hypothetical protein